VYLDAYILYILKDIIS
jgi:hypothetical protein